VETDSYIIDYMIGWIIHFVSNRPVALQPLLEHAPKHRNLRIDVVEHPHHLLALMDPIDLLLKLGPNASKHRQ